MTIPYLNGLCWHDLTREERFYCFCLYQNARNDPAHFAKLVTRLSHLNIPDSDSWDLGVEVCFYRDYLWHLNRPVRGSGFSPKRTFDLCLFNPLSIIVIEAKVDQPFDLEQNEHFANDARKIKELLLDERISVKLVALASSRYYEALKTYGSEEALQPFDGRISWADMHKEYDDPILKQADDLYSSVERKLVRHS